jgi:predicted DsbA family dithiol-disulfide isomerase
MTRFPLYVVVLLVLAGCPHGAPPPDPGPPLSKGEQDQLQALARAAEVDPQSVPANQQGRVVRLASEQKCPCPEVHGSLTRCATRKEKRCVRAPFAVRSIFRGVAREESDESINNRLMERFGPLDPESVDIDGVPCRGNESAPVVMVIFSDFQCPFCAMAVKLTEAVEHEAGDRLRVCFKHYPLTRIHKQARLAAEAAAAAQLHGKFWEMHDHLFAHQKELARDDLVDHARAIGLDPERFRADLSSEAVRARVRRDTEEARRLRLQGTPSFLINGRRMTDPKNVPEFLDWIAEALALGKQKRPSP